MPSVHISVTVRPLTISDLATCAWSGGPGHLDAVADALRAPDFDYLAVCPEASGLPVAIGGVNFAPRPGAGEITQLGVHPALQSCGLGTILITALEDRVTARGLTVAELGVETTNPRARALYERLGYRAFDTVRTGWDRRTEDGTVYRYETDCVEMRKHLTSASPGT
ncbi:GNAT family N-acetyltransferase [Phytomonospora endophytica]|uniref:GNAT superfamily N-acetyltransferase n=1 Tax=Phytomonospora endophytica TaxID=714109 RepID=A0A841FWA3_9ACTN|nr:GNAT family N-acetyltransferase [Phytomonospora endophytica]MBB6036260.1 GNAT superfamily N-acetyltransferase [Phytomonospora endophytica]